MYLKTLELQGFKSFPDKTVISFEPGLTAIVGANGSGKSNISDAVRWVLGEMSPKSLRSSKMEDVIFNGTAKRKPSSFAEVILTIDNSDYLMKIDYDEVSVSRRLYRSGESEYTINRQKARLKDVVDLFLNTGIGREGYSVISQGRIAEILSIKGSDRRDIFEEAAGISRFRYRKTEANAKLIQVNDNAQRIGDILAEVAERLPSLEKQSEKAVKYLGLAEEKRALEIAFWAQRLKTIAAQQTQVQADHDREEKELEKINDRLTQLVARLDEAYVDTQKQNLLLSQLTETISQKANERSEIAARLSVLENDIFHFSSQREAALAGSQQLSQRRQALQEQIQQRKAETLAQSQQVQQARQELEQAQSRLQELNGQLNEHFARQDQLVIEKDRLERLSQEQEMSRMEKLGFGQARSQRLDQIQAQLESRRQARLVKEQALAKAKEELARQEQELFDRMDQRDQLRAQQTQVLETLAKADDQKRQLDLKLLEINQRKETLLRMERLLEGFSGSVKEVMNAFERKELSGIHGPISRLIQTDDQYLLAIETALGAGIQNVVVEDEKSAKAAIAFLKRTRAGRATFLPLTTLRPHRTDLSDIHAEGLIGNAVDLVKCDKRFAPAVEFLLGRTAVARDIDCAARIAAQRNYNLRIVTLDGQIINAGGSYTGGQQLNKTGILSRTADIARLEEESALWKKKADLADRETRELVAQRDQLADQLKKNQDKLEALRQETNRAENEVKVEEELLENMNRADQALMAETQQLQEAGADQQQILDRLEQENQKVQQQTLALQEQMDRTTQAIRELNQAKEAQIEQNTQRISVLAAQEAKERSLTDAVAQLEARQQEESLEDRDLQEQARALQESIGLAREQIDQSKQLLAQTEKDLTQTQAQGEAAKEALAALEKESFTLREDQKKLTLEKDRQTDTCTQLKIRLDAFANETAGFEQKLREEYELEPDSEEFLNVPEGQAERLGGEVRLIFLRKEIKKLGNVNTDSVEEYRQTKERYDFLKAQYDDVVTSKNELEKLILSLEKTMREMFIKSFDQIRTCFKQTFVQLFGGGSADIVLTDPEDMLNCGIEINIQPPGKLVKNLSLLSGGEQAFVAIALYFAILKVNPTPFCIFDEIESALDEANIYRFAEYLKNNCDKTQFVVITHRRGTMEFANVLYGITMQEKGVSDFIRLDTASLEMFKTE